MSGKVCGFFIADVIEVLNGVKIISWLVSMLKTDYKTKFSKSSVDARYHLEQSKLKDRQAFRAFQ